MLKQRSAVGFQSSEHDLHQRVKTDSTRWTLHVSRQQRQIVLTIICIQLYMHSQYLPCCLVCATCYRSTCCQSWRRTEALWALSPDMTSCGASMQARTHSCSTVLYSSLRLSTTSMLIGSGRRGWVDFVECTGGSSAAVVHERRMCLWQHF